MYNVVYAVLDYIIIIITTKARGSEGGWGWYTFSPTPTTATTATTSTTSTQPSIETTSNVVTAFCVTSCKPRVRLSIVPAAYVRATSVYPSDTNRSNTYRASVYRVHGVESFTYDVVYDILLVTSRVYDFILNHPYALYKYMSLDPRR